MTQAIDPFFSPEDIAKGEQWLGQLNTRLQECSVGIFFITPASKDSVWMAYEAGAISKYVDSSRVCPLLFGLQPTELTGPLSHFQCAEYNKNELYKVLQAINNCIGASCLTEKRLEGIYEKWWEDIDHKISQILKNREDFSGIVEKRTNSSLLHELLGISRNIDKRVAQLRTETVSFWNQKVDKTTENCSLIETSLDSKRIPAVQIAKDFRLPAWEQISKDFKFAGQLSADEVQKELGRLLPGRYLLIVLDKRPKDKLNQERLARLTGAGRWRSRRWTVIDYDLNFRSR